MTWTEGARFMDRDRAIRAAGGDPERLRMLGWGDAPADAPLASLDPTGPRGAGAVACRYHPLRWAELHPELAPIVDRFQVVEPKHVTARDYEERSNLEVECLLTMGAAHARERVRRAKPPKARDELEDIA